MMTYEDALCASRHGTWESLSFASRLEVLQAVENHAAVRVGRTPRQVEGRWLHDGPDGVVLGEYDPADNRIHINNSQLMPNARYGKQSDDLLDTVLHEGRHAYQHQVVRGEVHHPDAEEVKAWAENMKSGNYVQFSQNPRAYWQQPIEADARAYASERLEELKREREALDQAESARAESAGAESARDVFERQVSTHGTATGGLERQAVSEGVSRAVRVQGRSQR